MMTATAPLFDTAPYEVDPLPPEPLPTEVTVTISVTLNVDAAALCVAHREKYDAFEVDEYGGIGDGYEEWDRGLLVIDELIRDQARVFIGGVGIDQQGEDARVDFHWDREQGVALADRMIPRYPMMRSA
jgi:hypothetical protein